MPDMVAIPALSYPRFFKIVRPSMRKSLSFPEAMEEKVWLIANVRSETATNEISKLLI